MGSRVYSRIPSGGLLLETPSSSKTGHGITMGDGQRAPDPCVDCPAISVYSRADKISHSSEETRSFTPGPPRIAPLTLDINPTAPPNLFRQLRDGNHWCKLHKRLMLTLRINSFSDSLRDHKTDVPPEPWT